MTVSPIHNNRSQIAPSRAAFVPRSQGLARLPDRLEDRNVVSHDNPPSLFKKILFEPIFEAIKFVLRGIFNFVDFLRNVAFEKPSSEATLFDRKAFIARLRTIPRPEELLMQFFEIYSLQEQDQIYRAVGEAHTAKMFWKEVIWARSLDENIAIGRRLVRDNPFLLQNYLSF